MSQARGCLLQGAGRLPTSEHRQPRGLGRDAQGARKEQGSVGGSERGGQNGRIGPPPLAVLPPAAALAWSIVLKPQRRGILLTPENTGRPGRQSRKVRMLTRARRLASFVSFAVCPCLRSLTWPRSGAHGTFYSIKT